MRPPKFPRPNRLLDAISPCPTESLLRGPTDAAMAAGQQIRYHTLNTETFRNQTHDIVDRLLLDSMADEVFVLQTVRDRLDPKTYEDVKRALEQIAARSRHIGRHLCELADTVDVRPKSTTINLADHI